MLDMFTSPLYCGHFQRVNVEQSSVTLGRQHRVCLDFACMKAALLICFIYSQYNNAMGIEPNLYSGRASTSGPTPFRSTAEVVTAMSDPRWEKDVSYTENVKARLAGSNVFG